MGKVLKQPQRLSNQNGRKKAPIIKLLESGKIPILGDDIPKSVADAVIAGLDWLEDKDIWTTPARRKLTKKERKELDKAHKEIYGKAKGGPVRSRDGIAVSGLTKAPDRRT
jgi:hypothetical protein